MNPHSNIFLTLGIVIRYHHLWGTKHKYHIQANVLELWYLKIIHLSQQGIYLWIIKKYLHFTAKVIFCLFFQGTLDISEIIITFIAYASWFRLALFYVNKKNCHLHAKHFLEADKILRLCIQRHIFRYTRKINTFMQSVFIETYKKYVTCIQRFIGNKVW